MGRNRQYPPRPHVRGNSERVKWGGVWYHLGPAGSTKATLEYTRLLALWRHDPYAQPNRSNEMLVIELCRDFLAAAPFSPGSKSRYKRACGLLCELYAATVVDRFGPVMLDAWQAWLANREPRLTRSYVAMMVAAVRSVWRWAAATERIPTERWRSLGSVNGLRSGIGLDSKKILPANAADVEAATAELSPTLRALVLVQRWTGARPSELFGLRPCDLDRSGPVWTFAPHQHKTAGSGGSRVIYFGPKAQESLRSTWPHREDGTFFDPRRSVEEKKRMRSARRVTKCYESSQKSNRERDRGRGRRKDRDRYSKDSYRQAVRRACLRAGVPVWSPYQLRHLRLDEVRASSGLEAAQAIGGHSRITTTQVYARRQEVLAVAAAANG